MSGGGQGSDPITTADPKATRSRRRAFPSTQRAEWAPRELRHSFVSLLRGKGVSISQFAGQKSTHATRRCTGTSCDRC